MYSVDGQADNLGTEFVIVFMRNEVEDPKNLPLELFITTPNTIPVQVRVKGSRQIYNEDSQMSKWMKITHSSVTL